MVETAPASEANLGFGKARGGFCRPKGETDRCVFRGLGRHAAGEDPAKRAQILEGARQVFMNVGFDAASMNDITRAAGVSKGRTKPSSSWRSVRPAESPHRTALLCPLRPKALNAWSPGDHRRLTVGQVMGCSWRHRVRSNGSCDYPRHDAAAPFTHKGAAR